MTAPLYAAAQQQLSKPSTAHNGLWFERFFNAYRVNGLNWEIPKPDDQQDAKRDWINSVTGATGEEKQLQAFAARQTVLVNHLNGRSQRYSTDWHFITGMGNPHPVENGFSWHPTLGVPYLTGAAVKGLVRAWVEGNDEQLPVPVKNARLKSWFGTADKSDVAEQAGGLLFYDAIPDSPPCLLCDIMTPHLGNWYSEGDKDNPNNSQAIPADWHEPVPVPFLAVKKARLVFSIAPRLPEMAAELDEVFKALSNALEWLGAGAKTATGYGYMTEDNTFSQEQAEAARQQMQQLAEQQRLASLSPLEIELETMLKAIPAQEHDSRLLQELEKGRWQDTDAQLVAQKIKTLMEQAHKWLPDYTGDSKPKVKHKERSLKVLRYL